MCGVTSLWAKNFAETNRLCQDAWYLSSITSQSKVQSFHIPLKQSLSCQGHSVPPVLRDTGTFRRNRSRRPRPKSTASPRAVKSGISTSRVQTVSSCPNSTVRLRVTRWSVKSSRYSVGPRPCFQADNHPQRPPLPPAPPADSGGHRPIWWVRLFA